MAGYSARESETVCDRSRLVRHARLVHLSRIPVPVGFEELDIPGIRLESNIEEVAEERDCADGDIDEDVGGHPSGYALGQLVVAEGDQYQYRLDEAGEHVATDRQQADQGIEPDGDACAGDVKGSVH